MAAWSPARSPPAALRTPVAPIPNSALPAHIFTAAHPSLLLLSLSQVQSLLMPRVRNDNLAKAIEMAREGQPFLDAWSVCSKLPGGATTWGNAQRTYNAAVAAAEQQPPPQPQQPPTARKTPAAKPAAGGPSGDRSSARTGVIVPPCVQRASERARVCVHVHCCTDLRARCVFIGWRIRLCGRWRNACAQSCGAACDFTFRPFLVAVQSRGCPYEKK